MFSFLFKTKIHPLPYPVYELDCTKHNNIFVRTKDNFNQKHNK